MQTKIISINPKNPEQEKITICANAIKQGKLVAFPTETIYGLGADALNEQAIKSIFAAKGRPADNPLIIHIANKQDLDKLDIDVSSNAKKLIDKFWPGPLTLIFKKSNEICNAVTAGLDTVAIRMPSNKIALELIKKAGPIAAPSANLSGRPSPTSAKHVIQDLNEKVDIIIDGGDSDIGLESTVLNLTSKIPTILRPGAVTLEQLKEILGNVEVVKIHSNQEVKSPGMKYTHYAPKAKVLIANKKDIQKIINKERKTGKVGVISFSQYIADDIFQVSSLENLAKNLFKFFREFDSSKMNTIVVESVPETGIGLAIMNRLKKAAGKDFAP